MQSVSELALKVKTPAWTTRAVSPAKEIRPEQVIPLEADDFMEF